MLFEPIDLDPSIRKALKEENYHKATPIQEKAIPLVLAGHDILASAQTGTGKTAAFAIPILQMIAAMGEDQESYHPIQVLVLAPTRELAIQIGQSFRAYGRYLPVNTSVVYGGVPMNRSIKALRKEPSILVSTPGRLLEMIGQGLVDLDLVRFLVLDEADRMLDLGMIQDVKDILSALPEKRQNLLFSATLPKAIQALSQSILVKPVRIEVKDQPMKKAKLREWVYFVDEPDKLALLLHLLEDASFKSVLVFVRTKKKADQVQSLIHHAGIQVGVIHGDKSQGERMAALEAFKSKKIRVLVATDVAARGIDIHQLSHVVNLNIPSLAETYVHRIGRTGRAGMKGEALSFCSNQEKSRLQAIEELQGKTIEVVEDHPFVMVNIAIQKAREKYQNKPKRIAQPRRVSGKNKGKKPSGKTRGGNKPRNQRSQGGKKKRK